VISLMAKSELPDQAAPVFIVLDVEFAHIGAHINQAGIGESGYCFVLDENNRLVYHPHQQLLNLDIKKEPLESLVKNKDGAQFIGETLFYTNSLRSVGWKVVGKSFVGDLIAKGQSTFILYLVAIFLFNFLMGILIAALLQRSISQPVHQLAAAMSSFTEHSEPFAFEGKMTTIELNQLTTAFNILTRRIHQLVENVRSESLQLRKTELKALQTQINPHFLYNTLDSIMWMCEQGRGREAVPMIEALASLFRISTSKGHDLIPIRNELKHAEAYLQIQSIRYDHAFSYHFDIDENCLDLLCNKITLQPLLENALYHGIQGMIDEGEMEIIVRDEGDRVALAVADNGIGMTPERAVEILSDEGRETVGIGLNNVHNRILIFFGEGYGLTIESEEDMGTVVTARFPKIKPEEGERYATI
jgi:two-component system sensor histidine kinase YesM